MGFLKTATVESINPTQITLTMPWKKARKLIKEDPRYKNFGDSDEASALSESPFLPAVYFIGASVSSPIKEKRSRV